MLTTLLKWDRWLFTKINHDWTNTFFDNVIPLWREGLSWVPLYIFLLIFIFLNFGKKAWPWAIGLLVTVSLTDQISSHLVKPFINRPRPCHDLLLAEQVNLLLGYCSNSRSFTSSHATNHFGLAVFIYQTLKPYLKTWRYPLFFWAASISYGQVYIGVHYPADVIGGAVLGSMIGYFTSYICNKRFGLPSIIHPPGGTALI